MPTMTSAQIQALIAQFTAQGTIPKQFVTAVHIKGADWQTIQLGTFELCEINFVDTNTGKMTAAGVLGFRYIAVGMEGRSSYNFAMLDSLSAVQLELPEATEG